MAQLSSIIRSSGRVLYAFVLAIGLATVAAPSHASGAASAGEAAEIAKQRSGGRILSVREAGRGKQRVYRVKVITAKGVVRVVTVRAKQ
jgi:hypothetical protein